MIRPATRADASELAGYVTQLGYAKTTDELESTLDRMAKDAASGVLVAESEGQLVGVVSFSIIPAFADAPWCRLSSLVVDGRWRRMGIGAALLAAVEEIARTRGCSLIEVTSGPQRHDAHAFYRGLGFEQEGGRFFGWKRLAASPAAEERVEGSPVQTGTN